MQVLKNNIYYAGSDFILKKRDMFVKHEHVPSEHQGHRSILFFCTSGKPLSPGTCMSNMKALSEIVKKLWPMLIFSLK